ncbi:MAG: MXAN_6577-like cysteine-rich protein [Myxococcota bacterium]|jgi:hypothetical protein|nr:MXAN_6577-like cysteine-rich protein [Myxococcota bacterium]
MRRLNESWVCAMVALSFAACGTLANTSLPGSACVENSDCPEGQLCDPLGKVCVDAELLDLIDSDDGQDTTGSCGGLDCPDGYECCGELCVDTKTSCVLSTGGSLDCENTYHCGECNLACSPGELCTNGICLCNGTECDPGSVCCGGETCIDVQKDNFNCGACDRSCPTNQECFKGECLCYGFGGAFDTCSSFQACCPDLGCFNFEVDPKGCGGCGIECRPGETCEGGVCVCDAAAGDTQCEAGEACCGSGTARGCYPSNDAICNCGGQQCASGQKCCVEEASGEQKCFEMASSNEHCGDCDNTCFAGYQCVGGQCDVSCLDGQTNCNNVCVNLQADTSNCGFCGNACDPGQVCSAGVCSLTCQLGLENCLGRCVNLQSDIEHCGVCGNACPSGNVCSSGACAITCVEGETQCGSGCVDLQTDRANCGLCGRACGTGTVCQSGNCTVSCLPGYTNCSGNCVQLDSDRSHCGTCGRSCNNGELCQGGNCVVSCPAGQIVCAGRCVDPLNDNTYCGASGSCTGSSIGTACPLGERCVSGSCELQCQSPQIVCGGKCVDPSSDRNYCGASGNCSGANDGSVCAPGEVCSGGTCALSCGGGLINCSGTCVDTDTNPEHCNGCEQSCLDDANVVASGTGCANGGCVYACTAGRGNCDGNNTNGCEQNLDNNTSHCGACGKVCGTTNVQNASCSNGFCQLICAGGYGDCNNNAADGCEALLNSATNCGGCGVACSGTGGSASRSCSNGTCVVDCNAGYENCDGNPANGCEVSITSTSNCGGCGIVCSTNHATPSCSNGQCVLACAAGWDDCDNDPSNGCETQLNTTTNCGACGNSCGSGGNASRTCTSGACVLTCASVYGDCDGNPSNGCETQLNTTTNCGACGNACGSGGNASRSCSSGVCVVDCNSGYEDCDGNPANGCEVNINTTSNCGGCGIQCSTSHATPTCTAGQCVLTCASGWGNCDGNPENGCETPLNTTTNCGACGNSCGSGGNASRSCTSGVCTLLCNSGYANCDNNPSNGCETSLSTSTNCGACGNSCVTGASCTGITGSYLCRCSSGQFCSYPAGSRCNGTTCQCGNNPACGPTTYCNGSMCMLLPDI